MRPLGAVLAAALLGLGGVSAAQPQTRIIDSANHPWSAIGRVNISGYRARGHCTGTLVAPDKVLTAGHCVLDPQTGAPFRAGRVHFLAGASRGAHVAHGRARCVQALPGAPVRGGAISARSLSQDAAVIVLREPLPGVAPMPIASGEPVGAALALAHYPLRRAFVLSLTEPCALTHGTGPLWRLSCGSEAGGSGGPVLDGSAAPAGPAVAAILTAVDAGGRGFATPSAQWRRLVAEAVCDAG